ncbi:C-C motif chemokine 4-like [Neopsephotus bourkii]|uniref:C-C motif chemokine 4-like n=1 Tax=Neopsephotus bourkii TaxID=309878 RepID=UPI002AA577C6|nr:C-C motif chemokine 4-like [Neopsephotus bourkii]
MPQLRSTMKFSAAALVALLLVAACSPSEAHLNGVPTTCCFTYQQRPIPRHLITPAYITSSSCSQPRVIMIITKKELCTDPRGPGCRHICSASRA